MEWTHCRSILGNSDTVFETLSNLAPLVSYLAGIDRNSPRRVKNEDKERHQILTNVWDNILGENSKKTR